MCRDTGLDWFEQFLENLCLCTTGSLNSCHKNTSHKREPCINWKHYWSLEPLAALLKNYLYLGNLFSEMVFAMKQYVIVMGIFYAMRQVINIF